MGMFIHDGFDEEISIEDEGSMGMGSAFREDWESAHRFDDRSMFMSSDDNDSNDDRSMFMSSDD
jgi:hypothetical protein